MSTVASQRAARRLSRRAALRLIGAGTVLGLAAACAPAAQTPPPTTVPAAKPPAGATTVAAPTPAAGQPKSGGTLRVAMIDPTPLDGHVISPNVFDTLWMAYEQGLTEYDDKLQPQPWLAESWDLSSGRQTG